MKWKSEKSNFLEIFFSGWKHAIFNAGCQGLGFAACWGWLSHHNAYYKTGD